MIYRKFKDWVWYLFYMLCINHIRFGKRDYDDSDPSDLMYEDMYFEKRAPMRFGKRSDDYFY